MKYYCISDVHGCYDKMIEALVSAGFNKEQDTLISVGDLFDRGSDSKKVLEFVMSCPHRILCMGNHDLRLMQLICAPYQLNQYDFSNGVPQTLNSFYPLPEEEPGLRVVAQLYHLQEDNLLRSYFRECIGAIEFSNLIITHGWIPTIRLNRIDYNFKEDWRDAHARDWEDAVWANTEAIVTNKIFPEKTILIGHWHAWRLAEKYGEKRRNGKNGKEEHINCSTFCYKDNFIAIDGCTNWPYGGCVNVYQFETDETPTLIYNFGVCY